MLRTVELWAELVTVHEILPAFHLALQMQMLENFEVQIHSLIE